ncbi:MAG TPA: methyltransferase [Planctomycetaceae bacterium]|nr:methyltransferase [Planctomycetaceae bacterium]
MPRRPRDDDDDDQPLRVRLSEQLRIDISAELPGGRMLCNTVGRGQFPRAYVAVHPEATAVCWFLDVYQRDQTAGAEESELEARIEWVCTADPPEDPFDLVVWGFGTRGETELVREMLQLGYQRLRDEGRFVAVIDNPDDQWLHTELKKLYPKVTRRPVKKGVIYLCTKPGPLAKEKNYRAEFVFRDREKLIKSYTRPSVFSHRHIDVGARTLINTMEIEPGQQVLDLGCGSGVVALAAASRAEDVQVLAVDSNPRALECVQHGATANGLTGIDTLLDAGGQLIPRGQFDLVLANPPYFSHYRIAELFLRMAHRALKPGGTVHVVTKTPKWFAETMPQYFQDVAAEQIKEYWVLTGTH